MTAGSGSHFSRVQKAQPLVTQDPFLLYSSQPVNSSQAVWQGYCRPWTECRQTRATDLKLLCNFGSLKKETSIKAIQGAKGSCEVFELSKDIRVHGCRENILWGHFLPVPINQVLLQFLQVQGGEGGSGPPLYSWQVL